MELFCYAAEEFTSGQISYAMIVHPDDLERVAKEVKAFSNEKEKTGVVHEPYRTISKDGKVTSNEHGSTFELFFPITREEISGKNLSIPLKDL